MDSLCPGRALGQGRDRRWILMRRAPSRRQGLGHALAVAVVFVVTAVSSESTAGADGRCDKERGVYDQLEAQRVAHNAKPHVFSLPQQQAAFNAYGAEAERGRAMQAAAAEALAACLETVRLETVRLEADQLEADRLIAGEPGSPPVKPATRGQIQSVNEAAKSVDPNRLHSGSEAGQKGHRVASDLRPVWQALRPSPGELGNFKLQGTPRPKGGVPEISRPGRVIGVKKKGDSMVSGDHIVPLAELIERPDFVLLSAENMISVANARCNLQWMASPLNSIKGSKSMAFVGGLDDAFWAAQYQLEANKLSEIDRLIQLLLRIQRSRGIGRAGS